VVLDNRAAQNHSQVDLPWRKSCLRFGVNILPSVSPPAGRIRWVFQIRNPLDFPIDRMRVQQINHLRAARLDFQFETGRETQSYLGNLR